MIDEATKPPAAAPGIIERAAEISRAAEAAFGSTTGMIHKKRFLVEAVLKASGIVGGAGTVTPQVVVALDAANDIAALLNAPMPTEPLAAMISTGINSAPIFEIYEQAARKVLANQKAMAEAAAKGAEPPADAPRPEQTEKAITDRVDDETADDVAATLRGARAPVAAAV